MKKRLISMILALAVVSGMLVAFTAAASSDSSFIVGEPEAPRCPRCHWVMELKGQSKDHCTWHCTNEDCPDSLKGNVTYDHQWKRYTFVEPDCKTMTDGKALLECQMCGEKKYITIPASHKAIVDPGVEPTCTEAGYTAGRHCGVCGDIIQPRMILRPLGHDITDEQTIKAPTCTEDGIKAGHCSRCGLIFQDAIPAIGHDYKVEKIIKPTCTNNGKKIEVCTHCGDKKETVLKASHQYEKISFIDRDFNVCKVCGDIRFVAPKGKAKDASDKVRDLANDIIFASIEDIYGKEVNNNTKFKLVGVNDKFYQFCIDEKPGSKEPKLFRLPMFFVIPNTKDANKAAAKPVKFEISVDNIDSKNLDDFSTILISGKDKFELPDVDETNKKYSIETKTPGLAIAVKDSVVEKATKQIEELKKSK